VQVSQGACVRIDSIEITGNEEEGLLFIPNAFTPNGNGNNDVFLAYGQGITSFHMRIFNRWGELLFETSDMNNGWDGRYKGQIVQTDTYVYTIDYETTCEGAQLKNKIGHVNVVR
jgi:gliding motility-associated-like protein